MHTSTSQPSLMTSNESLPANSIVNDSLLPPIRRESKAINANETDQNDHLPLNHTYLSSMMNENQTKPYKHLFLHKRIKKPKNVRSAYNFYAKSIFNKYKKNTSLTNSQLIARVFPLNKNSVMNQASEEWKLLSDEEKKMYQKKHTEDVLRYKNEVVELENDLNERGIHYIPSAKGILSFGQRYGIECIKAITKGIEGKDIRLFVSGILSYNVCAVSNGLIHRNMILKRPSHYWSHPQN